MTVAGQRPARRQASEEVVAAARVVLGLTIAVGGMATLIGAATGQSAALLLAVPTVALGLGIGLHRLWLAGWAGVGVWLLLLPSAHGEALLAPVAMTVMCAAVAIGPGRFAGWVGRDFAGGRVARRGDAWIEEDGRPLE
jgi:hypothetical protein